MPQPDCKIGPMSLEARHHPRVGGVSEPSLASRKASLAFAESGSIGLRASLRSAGGACPRSAAGRAAGATCPILRCEMLLGFHNAGRFDPPSKRAENSELLKSNLL